MTRPFAALLVATVPILASCRRGDADAGEVPATARTVVVDVVRDEPLAPPVLATGVIAGKEEVPLSFKVGGVVERVAVDEGQRVTRGQVLARLSPDEITAMAARAAEARTKARRDVDRIRALHADSVATLVQLQDATTALEVAEQDVRVVEFNRAHSVIRAPADGIVLRRHTEPNALVAAGAAIVTLRTEDRGVVLRVGLADRDAVRVRVGDAAVVELDAWPGEPLRGRVSQVAAAASPQTGTFEVEIALGGARHPLASGLIARASIAVGATGTWPMLPLDAVVEAGGDSAIVFVVPRAGNVAERRVVRVGQIAGTRAVVTAGLARGERVVVRGGAYLQDGAKVTIAAAREDR